MDISLTGHKRSSSSDVTHVPRLENVIVNVRDANGRAGAVREFLLVFPGLSTNTRTSEVMRMVEHQLKQKLQRTISGRAENDTRLVLAGAGLTIVQHVGGHFQQEMDPSMGGAAEARYVPEDDGIVLSTRHALGGTGPGACGNATLAAEPVQWKAFSGCSGLYNLLDGSLIDEDELLDHPGKGLEARDVRAMVGYKYALLEAQVFLDERLWSAFDAAPRADAKALKVAVRRIGDGESSGALASPIDMAVRVLAQGVADELKPHTAQVLVDIQQAVEAAADELAEAMPVIDSTRCSPDEEDLRRALLSRLTTLKRTVHFKAYHPDRTRHSGLSVEHATTMAAWLEEVYTYILRRRLGGEGEEQVVFERT